MTPFTKANTSWFFVIIIIRIINEKERNHTKWKKTKIKYNRETNVIPLLWHEMPGKELEAIL